MTGQRDFIIKAAFNLNKRAESAAKTNQILITVYDDLFQDLKKWGDGTRCRSEFLNDYNRYLLIILAIELSVILDPVDSSKQQYSIDALLNQINTYLHKDNSPDGQLFDRPSEINSSIEFGGFAYLKAENLPLSIDDKIVLTLLRQEKKDFLKQHASDLKTLKKTRDTFLAHPDMNGVGTLPSPNFFISLSEWCFAYCNLLLNTLTASGVRLYTKEGRDSSLGRKKTEYREFFLEVIKP